MQNTQTVTFGNSWSRYSEFTAIQERAIDAAFASDKKLKEQGIECPAIARGRAVSNEIAKLFRLYMKLERKLDEAEETIAKLTEPDTRQYILLFPPKIERKSSAHKKQILEVAARA